MVAELLVAFNELRPRDPELARAKRWLSRFGKSAASGSRSRSRSMRQEHRATIWHKRPCLPASAGLRGGRASSAPGVPNQLRAIIELQPVGRVRLAPFPLAMDRNDCGELTEND